VTTDVHASIRALKPGCSISKNGVQVVRLENGDLSFKLDMIVGGRRCRDVLGRQSDGMTLRRALEAAQARRGEARRNLGLIQPPATEGPRTPFRRAAEAYLLAQVATGARNVRRKAYHLKARLIPYFGERAIGSLTEEDLHAYRVLRRAENASDATINREMSSLSHMLAWTASGTRKWIPKGHVAIPKTPETRKWREVLCPAEIEALLTAARGDLDPLCYLFCCILVSVPLRHTEALRIRYTDIDWEHAVIHIGRAKSGPRVQPVPPALIEILAEARKRVPDPDGWLFPNRRPAQAKAPHVTTMGRAFKRAVTAAKLDSKRVVPHLCRHTGISTLASLGVGTFVLQQVSGHKTAQVVERYVHLHGPQIRAAIAPLGANLLRRSPESHPPAGRASPGEAAQIIEFPKKAG
jgi:integrase